MKFYVYGGMIKGQNTKLHISNEDGEPLCGVKSFWMEMGETEIEKDGYVDGYFQKVTEMDFACKKCIKKWKEINYETKTF